jgi:hypothetical protein
MVSKNQATRVALFLTVAAAGLLTTSSQGFAQSSTNAPATTQPSAPVTIVSPLPLPITGSVGLAAGGSVQISNPTASPVPVRDVDQAAKELFQTGSLFTEFVNGFSSTDLVTVPANKRLVIEHFSATVNVFAADGLTNVNLAKKGSFVGDEFPCMAMGSTASGLNHYFACSAPTKFYASAGDTTATVVTANFTSGGFYRVFISGYYVPVP